MQKRRHGGGGAELCTQQTSEDGFKVPFELLQQHVDVKDIVAGDGAPCSRDLELFLGQIDGWFGLGSERQRDDHMAILGTLAALDAKYPHIVPAMDLHKIVGVVASTALYAPKLGEQLQ